MTRLPNSGSQPAFQACQYKFAAHIRDPKRAERPAGVEDRRMGIYRELLYNNVQDIMASSFPVLRMLLSEDAWHRLMRDYFARHKAHTPLFPQMPQEFLRYLETERDGDSGDLPFLRELAQYEWVGLALSIDTRELDTGDVDTGGDLLAGVPVLSPLAWPLAYRYPVHRIGPEFQPRDPPAQPSYLLVYRNRADDVGFLEINPVTARLLELIAGARPPSGEQALLCIADELNHPAPEVVVNGGLEILQDLKGRDVILGIGRGT